MSSSEFPSESSHVTRRSLLRRSLAGTAAIGSLAAAWGTFEWTQTPGADAGLFELAWGYQGNRPGNLQRPRAITVDDEDRVYVADMTDRIQVFSVDGEFLTNWRLPAFDVDGSTGLSINSDGNLMVADTHFYRIMFYRPDGGEVTRIQSQPGRGAGDFGYLRDIAEDSDGFLFTCEYGGGVDRIQIISPEHEFVGVWGRQGTRPGELARPEALIFDKQQRLFVADSCNHRIQVFQKDGKLINCWGNEGKGLGELFYPTDVIFDHDGNLIVCEHSNHRIQKFTPEGKSLGAWGGPGTREGRLHFPWGVAVDRQNRIFVADAYNHRIQRITM